MARFELHHGDCLEVLKTMPDNSVDAVVCDPPYGLSFMGRKWDYDVPEVAVWAECLRVLKPGGHLLAFAGTRTQHRMAVRIEDTGFEIRDMIAWVYGSGFPKSLDVSKAIDKAQDYRLQSAHRRAWVEAVQEAGLALPGNSRHDWTIGEHAPGNKWWAEFESWLPGLSSEKREAVERIVLGKGFKPRPTFHTASIGGVAETNDYDITAPATDAARQWQGWGTALKPALEPITVARKPFPGTVAENVLAHGTGALNIDGCRVPSEKATGRGGSGSKLYEGGLSREGGEAMPQDAGRWPANLIHDGSPEVLAGFPQAKGAVSNGRKGKAGIYGDGIGSAAQAPSYGDTGSAARFFYCAKASKRDRDDGLDGFAHASPGEMTGGRTEGSAGLNNPRAGAGRTGGGKNVHPTVKPTDLMAYLCRLVTPPGGVVLDPFMGSGSTGKAAVREGFRFIGIEREAEYLEIARARISAVAPEVPSVDDLI